MSRIISIVTILALAAFTSQSVMAGEISQATGLNQQDLLQYSQLSNEQLNDIVAGTNSAEGWGWFVVGALILGFGIWAGTR